MAVRRPGRLKTFDYIGRWRYFLTVCTNSRRPVFRDAAVVENVLGHFLHFAARDGFEITAHSFMPDHVHFLVQGTRPDSLLPRFMNSAKQQSGFQYTKVTGGRLWDKGSMIAFFGIWMPQRQWFSTSRGIQFAPAW
jgi:REP element-mobilizing transposase RayT